MRILHWVRVTVVSCPSCGATYPPSVSLMALTTTRPTPSSSICLTLPSLTKLFLECPATDRLMPRWGLDCTSLLTVAYCFWQVSVNYIQDPLGLKPYQLEHKVFLWCYNPRDYPFKWARALEQSTFAIIVSVRVPVTLEIYLFIFFVFISHRNFWRIYIYKRYLVLRLKLPKTVEK